jgi:hypothetical protein
MKLTQNFPWPRILAEGAVIVVSILLAFWIDAWWGRQQESERERILLESLLTDLKALKAEHQFIDQSADAILESARELLDIGRSTEASATDRDIDFLLNDVTYRVGGNYQGSHVLSMLLTGGELANIQSIELREALVDLRFALVEEEKSGQREIEFMDNSFLPFLYSHASLAQIWGADDGQPGMPEFASDRFPVGREGIQSTEISHRALLNERQFQNLIIKKIDTVIAVKGWQDSVYDVDAQLRDCVALIEDVLAE